MLESTSFIFAIAVLIMSVVAHEVAHGYAAERLGDRTARMAGRLTLNPIKHLDPIGSFVVPVFLFFVSGFAFGWARPVPYNPNNMRDPRWGGAVVAAAGPLTNLALAVIFGMLIRFGAVLGIPAQMMEIAQLIVFINVLLAVFNLLPVPPLDGSKVLFAALPYRLYYIQDWMEQYWWVIFPVLLIIVFHFGLPFISSIHSLIVGF